MPSKFAPVPKFAPGRVAPQAARYWPGKRLEEDKESSDEYDSEEEEEAEEEQVEQEPAQRQPPPKEKVPEAGTKLITTMRSASIAEEGPYQPPEEDSSEEESEEEEDAANNEAVDGIVLSDGWIPCDRSGRSGRRRGGGIV